MICHYSAMRVVHDCRKILRASNSGSRAAGRTNEESSVDLIQVLVSVYCGIIVFTMIVCLSAH